MCSGLGAGLVERLEASVDRRSRPLELVGVGFDVPYQLLADVVLVFHFAVVVFVVGGLLVVLVGNLLGHWPWVNSFWFRVAHLVAIAFIVAQSWLEQVCPLTTLESWLRVQAGSTGYRKSFVEHWVQAILFYEASPLTFAIVYSAFAALVAFAWWRFPPRARRVR